jgi:putative oxidoreductase
MSDQQQTGGSLYFPFMAGFYEKFSDLGYPIIRFFTGLILMPHGAQKLFGMFGGGGLSGTAGFFSKVGLEPAFFLATLVGCVEFIGGALLAIGLFTRFAAAAITIELLVAAFYVKMAKGFFVFNGGYEFELLWALVAFGIFLHGSGKYSVDAKIGKEL